MLSLRLLIGLLVGSLPALASEDGPRVVIDPGHGGSQEGAVGPDGYFEKTLSLQLALRVKEGLEKALKARVSVTRERDVGMSLSDRVTMANREKPDLFLSIHANSMPTRQQREHSEGVETFFLSASASDDEASRTADRENAESSRSALPSGQDTLAFILADLARTEAHGDSSRLAYAVHSRVISQTHALDRGVQQAPFYVLMGVTAPAILVEVGFISHPRESRKLRDPHYQELISRAVVDGVKTFWDEVGRKARGPALARPAGR